MKQLLRVLLLMLVVLTTGKQTVSADNVEFEQSYNFMAYDNGNGSIHVKVLVWAYGYWYNHWADTGSTLVYRTGTNTEAVDKADYTSNVIIRYKGENDKNSDSYVGYSYVEAPNSGEVLLTKKTGETDRYQLPAGSKNWYELKETSKKGDKYLEFDWYPPVADAKKQLRLMLKVNDTRYDWTNPDTYYYDLGTINLNDPLSAVQLFDATFNSSSDPKLAGKLALPYYSLSQPVQYTTSLDPQTAVSLSNHSGFIYVDPADTCVDNFYVKMTILNSAGNQREVYSEPAKVAAYHEIRNFKAERLIRKASDDPFLPDMEYDGHKRLTWQIEHPSQEDIMSMDEFEIQRAYRSDFSDAETIGYVPYEERDGNSQTSTTKDGIEPPMNYEYIDSVPEAWNNMLDPDAPVYYRIRRASAYLWGWDHHLVKTGSVSGKVFLAAHDNMDIQARGDKDFASTGEVEITIPIRRCYIDYERTDTAFFAWPAKMKLCIHRYESDKAEPTVIKLTRDDLRLHWNPTNGYIEATYTDQLLRPCVRYGYSVSIDTTGCTRNLLPYGDAAKSYGEKKAICERLIVSEDYQQHREHWETTDFYFSNAAQVVDFHVSQGEYNDRVVLTWNISEGASERFIVSRWRESQSPWEGVTLKDSCDFYSYVDTTAVPGVKYNYRVTSEVSCDYVTTHYADALGWKADYATVSGTVRYGDDIAAGGQKIVATLKENGIITSMETLTGDGRNERDMAYANTLNGVPQEGTVSFWISAGKDATHFFNENEDADSRVLTFGDFTFELHSAQGSADGSTPCERLDVRYGDKVIAHGIISIPTDGTNHFDYVSLTYDLNNRAFCLGGTLSDIIQESALPADATLTEEKTMRVAAAQNLWLSNVQVWNRQLTTSEQCSLRYDDISHEDGVVVWLPMTYESTWMWGIRNMSPDTSVIETLPRETNFNVWASSLLQTVACHVEREYEAYTSADGTYTISHIPTNSGGINVRIESSASKFEAKNGDTQYDFSVSSDHNVISGADFYCYDLVTMAGRVLYEGTTVPVQGVEFLLNGMVQKSANNVANVSDAQGTYTLTLPKNVPVTVQARLHGHTFLNDGFFQKGGENTFALEKDLEANMYDETKVRVIGRLAGGADQAAKPLGFGESRNTLGDDLQMVLSLEGNDVAYLIYNPDSTEIKEKDTTIAHLKSGQYTKMHTERKRLVVNPDVESGEFYIDLLPVKYKITQATAKGYSTLFDKNSTSQVIDLTNSLTTLYDDKDTDRQVPYNATYQLTYHSPISLTCTQMNTANQALDYYGLEHMGLSDFEENQSYLPLFTRTPEGISYTFGYPVFNGHSVRTGEPQKYRFLLSAHEDYYYNNDKDNGRHERVMMKESKVKIQNGFDSSTAVQTQQLDLRGERIVELPVCNPNFTMAGDDALRTLTMEVEVNGEHILASPLKAYVLGSRDKGSEVLGTDVNVVDVLRDPPGSLSYAWLDEGTTFSSSYTETIDFAVGLKLDFSLGYSVQWWIGIGDGTYGDYSNTTDFPLNIVASGKKTHRYNYSFNTSKRIQTSSSAFYVGNDGNVYIGHELGVRLLRRNAITAINEENYARIEPAIKEGIAKVITTGKDSQGKDVYLVIGEEMTSEVVPQTEFAYSQRHIVRTLIPELETSRNALLLFEDSLTLQRRADQDGKVYYRSLVPLGDPHFAQEGYYQGITPSVAGIYPDRISDFNLSIASWKRAIAANEELTVRTLQRGKLLDNFIVSDGTSKQYSETANMSFQHDDTWNYPFYSGSAVNSFINNASGVIGALVKKLKYSDEKYKEDHHTDNIKDKDGNEVDLSSLGVKLTIKPTLVLNLNVVPSQSESHGKSRQMGFKIEEGNNGHVSVGVYRVASSIVKDQAEGIAFDTTTMNGKVVREEAYYDDNDTDNPDCQTANFVYYLNGGATRCPYENVQFTQYYEPGKFKLGDSTEKIDNPTIVVQNPVQTNVPADEAAVFDLILSNESEVPEAERGIVDQTLNLIVIPESNPNGAKLSLDGQPLTSGMSLLIYNGTSVHKKLEVRRGTVDDYEDITLRLSTSCQFANGMEAKISVHFQPTSTDLSISTPTDKWIMNTLSPRDSIGYYLPVRIEGFDPKYHNFDHIELQYKKSTQPDEAYVNMCSYYADDELYEKASGTKRKISGGVIDDIFFYGDKDPIEYNYDLRAVSFCRLGNSYVTKSSKVISGLKDTRRPELFGTVTPENGILGIGDYISIPFSEDIAGNLLDATNNFQVQGYTNENGITASTALQFSAMPVTSEVVRNLSNSSFTIDLMMKADPKRTDDMVLFSQGTADRNVSFGLGADNCLFMQMKQNDEVTMVKSARLEAYGNWVRVVGIYTAGGEVTFFEGTDEKKVQNDAHLPAIFKSEGPIRWGADIDGARGYQGLMLEARLWQTALQKNEITQTDKVQLTGYERNLLAYYPMNEGHADIINDKAHGASMALNGQTWELPTGYSLQFDGSRGVQLDDTFFSRNALADYTLSFWFRADKEQPSSTATLFAGGPGTGVEQGGEGHLFIGMENHYLVLRQNGMEQRAAYDVCDDTWHQLVLTVDRSTDVACLYVDGKRLMQMEARVLGALHSTQTYLGGCYWEETTEAGDHRTRQDYFLRGNIDEVTLWEYALSENYLKEFLNTAPYGGEMGLLYYLPLSRMQRNAFDILEPVFNPLNCVERNETNGARYNARLLLTDDAVLQQMASAKAYAPVRQRGELTNIGFTWASKDNELVIKLKPQDWKINKQNIFVTVRDVEDLAGNTMLSPMSWTVFVDRNALKWSKKYVTQDILYGEETDFSLDIRNLTGSTMYYQIEDLPDWLSVDNSVGTALPTDEFPVAFHVSNTLDPGHHTAIVALTDQNGLSEPLLVTVNVRTEAPEWEMNEYGSTTQMNIIAQVNIVERSADGTSRSYIDTDENDILGAFFGDYCVGKTNIKRQGNGMSEAFLTVRGTDQSVDKKLTFLLWRASTGKISVLEGDEVSYHPNRIEGTPERPVQLYTSMDAIQHIDLRRGWNWISFNIKPWNDPSGMFGAAFVGQYRFSANDVIKSEDCEVTYTGDAEDGWLFGDDVSLNHRQSYMMLIGSEGTLSVVGTEITTAEERTLSFRHGWNHLPYLSKRIHTVEEAMSDYTVTHAQEGDVIKGHTEFAMMSETGHWVGSLTHMRPGNGYMLLRKGMGEVAFCYPLILGGEPQKARGTAPMTETTALELRRSHNMPIVATAILSDGTEAREGAVMRAYEGDELVGEAVADEEGRFFLMTSADEGSTLEFCVSTDGMADDEQPRATTTVRYDSRYVVGTTNHPFLVTYGEDYGEGSPRYDLAGRRVSAGKNAAGIYITRDKAGKYHKSHIK